MNDNPLLTLAEVTAISGVCGMTLSRMEKRGQFPRRVRLSPGLIAWRRPDIEAWAADPEACRRQQVQSGA
ncbi:AlpA family phage regulatory protein [Bradyrhizobium jicamae]|uniref:AlpA family phage regulatory protein n=1 Tax=Bradyrhizobium jicamae TaxID=280332 RepID=A0ABS5FWE1_9BRAD|nr:AlpA family phage regulatory protein [Bradyrhizobium jicamae]MBR0801068.1 AlpA family phage regulatory protein [Bradyrhizobium jicamae]